jgi:hypothetical protein
MLLVGKITIGLINNGDVNNSFIVGRWYILDGALNIIYFIVFLAIIMLWRPTSNNERYGLHQLTDIDPDIGKL